MKSLQINNELHYRIKLCCTKRNMTIGNFCEQAINNLLEELESPDYVTYVKDGKVIEEYKRND